MIVFIEFIFPYARIETNLERTNKKEMVHLLNINQYRREFAITLFILISLIVPFVGLNYLNIEIFNIGFNPVDFILKPFMIIPVTSLLLALLTEWTIYAVKYIKNLKLSIKKRYGHISIKLVKKSLPITIIDESYFNEEFQKKNMIIVDMRIKDHKPLSFHDDLNVLKLFRYDQHLNIPYLLEKANSLIQDTALKNKPITFIVDGNKERNRTISKVWLRLICNPHSKSADDDIHTLLGAIQA